MTTRLVTQDIAREDTGNRHKEHHKHIDYARECVIRDCVIMRSGCQRDFIGKKRFSTQPPRGPLAQEQNLKAWMMLAMQRKLIRKIQKNTEQQDTE